MRTRRAAVLLIVLLAAGCEIEPPPESPPQRPPEWGETRGEPVTPPESEVTRDLELRRDTQVFTP